MPRSKPGLTPEQFAAANQEFSAVVAKMLTKEVNRLVGLLSPYGVGVTLHWSAPHGAGEITKSITLPSAAAVSDQLVRAAGFSNPTAKE